MPTILAQLHNPVLPQQLGSPTMDTGGAAGGKLISSIIGVLLIVAFLLAFLYMIAGGISWVTSGGDKANLEKARNKIINAIEGLFIVAASYAIFKLVGQFLGLDVAHLPFPTL
jgi:hypothetical protein